MAARPSFATSRLPRRRPTRKRPIPRGPTRRALSPQPPRAVELFYVAALREAARGFSRAVKRVLFPHLHRFAAPPKEVERHDADPDDDDEAEDLEQMMASLEAAVREQLESGVLPKQSDEASRRVLKHSQHEFTRLGINLIKAEPHFGPLIDTWRKQTVDRIRSVEADQLKKVERILKEGSGLRVEALTKQLEWQLDGVTASRAELIARDQVLTLNAVITKHRQEAAGIERFVWTTSGDERVRDSHEEIDGMEFAWDDPPIVDGEPAFPGDPINCRCTAFPILPELDDPEDE